MYRYYFRVIKEGYGAGAILAPVHSASSHDAKDEVLKNGKKFILDLEREHLILSRVTTS